MNLEATHYPFKRSSRVGQLIQKEISAILLEMIKDPRVGLVTLTDVQVSDDLKSARVYFSILGSEKEKSETTEGLQSAKGFIQGELGRRLRLRYTPKITFFYDGSFERADRIDRLLKDLM